MYADVITDSMRVALDETARRRAIQMAYNEEHGIEPQTIRKAINSIMDQLGSDDDTAANEPTAGEALADEIAAMGKGEVLRMIAMLEEQMAESAEKLDFEAAARLRDQIVSLRAKVESTDEAEALKRLKSTARKGSYAGTRKNMAKHRR